MQKPAKKKKKKKQQQDELPSSYALLLLPSCMFKSARSTAEERERRTIKKELEDAHVNNAEDKIITTPSLQVHYQKVDFMIILAEGQCLP